MSQQTWLQLDAFYEFVTAKLMQAVMQNKISRIGVLSLELTEQLLICVTNAEDITPNQERIVQTALKDVQANKQSAKKTKA